MLSDNIRYDGSEVTLVTGIALSSFTLDRNADRIWDEGKVLIVPGCSFEVDKYAVNSAWRMNFSMPTPEDLKRGTQIVVKCAGEMLK